MEWKGTKTKTTETTVMFMQTVFIGRLNNKQSILYNQWDLLHNKDDLIWDIVQIMDMDNKADGFETVRQNTSASNLNLNYLLNPKDFEDSV